jgi:light-regulated signal transduction histidine kinase (bacteriophytochrome)
MNEQLVRVAESNDEAETQGAVSLIRAELMPCVDELIHMPGSIQTHGFLLGLDAAVERVIFASENAQTFLGIPMKLLLGSTIDLFLELQLLASIRALKDVVDPDGLIRYLGAFQIRGELCSVVTHCVEDRRVLEFERQERLVAPEMMNAVITNFLGILSNLRSEEELCQAIAKQFKELTGFDRVLLYSFDAAGHGTVIVEENDGSLPSMLGLHFPADDIPPPARALYVLNTVRTIPNASYVPIPILGLPHENTAQLDMSFYVLRSVSPFHLEYMRNMGTLSSMSVSIVSEGKLWGLISGHRTEPHLVPYLIRSACDMLTKMVGTQLTAFLAASRLQAKLQLHEVQRSTLTQIASENDYVSALTSQVGALIDVTIARGVVLAIDGYLNTFGDTPEVDYVRRLIDWLDSQPGLELYETNQLSAVLPWAAEIADTASGFLAIRFSDIRSRYILWFRPEIVRTVHWAGEPVKRLDENNRPHPRMSFAAWKQTVHMQSLPWSSTEVESAREFRAALTTISLRRLEEEAALSDARFNKLAYALPVKIFAVNDAGQLTYVNDQWRSAGHVVLGTWYEAAGLAAADATRCAASWASAVEGELEYEEEVRLLAPSSGRESWNLVRLVPFHREGAGRAGWIGTCTDLTERKSRETALRVAEKLTLTGRMTSFLGHEINNPLEAITNVLYLAKQSLPDEIAVCRYLGMADDELERISGIVKQTLRWNAENSDKRGWTTVGALYEDILRLSAAKIRNRQIHINIEGGAEIPVWGIVGQIRQILAHLVSNALDAAFVGGNVWLRAEQLQNEIEIVVVDDGVGMSEAEQSYLFDPFYSTKGDLGNGLGLYIAKEIAERHKGRFLIESKLGSGTTIRLRLPSPSQNVAMLA